MISMRKTSHEFGGEILMIINLGNRVVNNYLIDYKDG